MDGLTEILRRSASRHRHLCPRQVLGARMGLLAGGILSIDLPRTDKRLLIIAETDGCAVDGIIAATGCTVGHRTLRIEDYGKIAATFVDTCTEEAIRIAPRREARTLALDYAPSARNRWAAMLLAYQAMPANDLFTIQAVQLTTPLAKIISLPGKKSVCDDCGEEIINGREIINAGAIFCQSCAGNAYYTVAASPLEAIGAQPIGQAKINIQV
jgi:formylmethanofuran dehydrogenase subunit E